MENGANAPFEAPRTSYGNWDRNNVAADSVQNAKDKNKKKVEKENKKAAKRNSARANGNNAAAASASNKKILAIVISLTAAVLIVCLVVGLLVAMRSCNAPASPDVPNNPAEPDTPLTMEDILKLDSITVNSKKNATQVGFSAEILGTADRVKPIKEVKDGGLKLADGSSAYPVYNATKTLTAEEKSAILAENNLICAKPTSGASGTYDKMDKDGFLYLADGTPVLDAQGSPRRLYKHSASIGLYGGNVADGEPGVVKKVTLRPRSYSSYYSVTGVYAPAGEVVKIRISEADMEATGGIVIHIGQALYNGQANNIWSARNFNRMPVILNTMNVTKETSVLEDGYYVAYVGSFLGGPIYIRDEKVTFSVEISGAVNYPHFILGVTTEEEFEDFSRSSAPYFDLEVWDSGVLHSGPKSLASSFSYDDLYKAAVFWEKISIVSTKIANQGIVFIYDPFVAAGAAVAFPGRRSVNCPLSWMTASLNYSGLVTGGSWGNTHEYHHNFQGGWGVGYTGEVTNNALNLVSYSLFTKISSARQLASFGGAGLSSWNTYTSATWALNRIKLGGDNITSTNGLAVYSTLLHNFGQDAFIKSAKGTGAAYFNKWAEVTHNNFSYFQSLVSAYSGNLTLAENDYPMFVPVSSVFQTGRSYNYDGEKRYIKTMQPYAIPMGEAVTVDLRPYTVNSANQYLYGSVVIPDGFTYRIKSINASGINGTFAETDEKDVYTFTPNGEIHSKEIVVTLEITNTNNTFEVDDVDLVLEFEQSREHNKNLLERKVITYEAGKCPIDAEAAFDSNYAGNIGIRDEDNINPTQNSNTDVWMAGADVPLNSIIEVSGKLYFQEAGKYRIAFRGRWNVALYLSFDGGKSFELKAKIVEPAGGGTPNFKLSEGTYCDVEVGAESWIYFKEVMVCGRSGGKGSYFGIGVGKFTTPMYTITTDDNGNRHYWNSSGVEVSEQEAGSAEPIAPTGVSYATAYRNDYEFQRQFESDYFYLREYSFSYSGKEAYGENAGIVDSNIVAWDETPLENMLFDNADMFRAKDTNPSPSSENPSYITVDMGREVYANRCELFGYMYNGGKYYPVNFYILVGKTLDDMVPFGPKFTGVSTTNGNTGFTIDGAVSFRYYKIVIEKWSLGAVQFRHVAFKYIIKETGRQISPDDESLTYKGSWEVEHANASFGHVYVGKNATLEFEFEGNRLALLASREFGTDYEVYIDGEKSESVFRQADGEIYIEFMSAVLENKKHKVVIYCKNSANIDSIILY